MVHAVTTSSTFAASTHKVNIRNLRFTWEPFPYCTHKNTYSTARKNAALSLIQPCTALIHFLLAINRDYPIYNDFIICKIIPTTKVITHSNTIKPSIKSHKSSCIIALRMNIPVNIPTPQQKKNSNNFIGVTSDCSFFLSVCCSSSPFFIVSYTPSVNNTFHYIHLTCPPVPCQIPSHMPCSFKHSYSYYIFFSYYRQEDLKITL